jgi:hypothetical protein
MKTTCIIKEKITKIQAYENSFKKDTNYFQNLMKEFKLMMKAGK